jgi:hypothetical protein
MAAPSYYHPRSFRHIAAPSPSLSYHGPCPHRIHRFLSWEAPIPPIPPPDVQEHEAREQEEDYDASERPAHYRGDIFLVWEGVCLEAVGSRINPD